jgi:hypothetical protein
MGSLKSWDLLTLNITASVLTAISLSVAEAKLPQERMEESAVRRGTGTLEDNHRTRHRNFFHFKFSAGCRPNQQATDQHQFVHQPGHSNQGIDSSIRRWRSESFTPRRYIGYKTENGEEEGQAGNA